MLYRPVKGIFKTSLLAFDDEKSKYVPERKGVKVKFIKDLLIGETFFKLYYKGKELSPKLSRMEVFDDGKITGIFYGDSVFGDTKTLKVDIDLERGQITPYYIFKSRNCIADENFIMHYTKDGINYINSGYKTSEIARSKDSFGFSGDVVWITRDDNKSAIFNTETLTVSHFVFDKESCVFKGSINRRFDRAENELYFIERDLSEDSTKSLSENKKITYFVDEDGFVRNTEAGELVWKKVFHEKVDGEEKQHIFLAFKTKEDEKEITKIIKLDSKEFEIEREYNVSGKVDEFKTTLLKDGSLLLVLFDKTQSGKVCGASILKPDGSVQELLESEYKNLEVKKDDSGYYIKYSTGSGMDYKFGTVGLSSNQPTREATVGEFVKLTDSFLKKARKNESSALEKPDDDKKGFGGGMISG